jgi:hypothetical protein
VLAVCGLATAFRSQVTGYHRPTEAWLERQIPATIGGLTFIPSAENPMQSYRMDAQTYKALDPIGIVCRTYTNGRDNYDVVVIMGDDPNTFHDQTWCFRGQGWTIRNDQTVQLHTRTYGDIPARLISLEGANGPATMVFTFRGPSGRFFGTFGAMWRDFLLSDITGGKAPTASFIRILRAGAGAAGTVEALTAAVIDSTQDLVWGGR